MQARKFTTNVPKIIDLKSSSEQIFFRKLSLGAPVHCYFLQLYIAQAAKSPRLAELAKKVLSNSLGLVDFAIGLACSVLNLPNRQVNVFPGILITEEL